MPMYRFNRILDGRVIATQDVELTDDEAALHEVYDDLDPSQQVHETGKACWTEAHRVLSDGSLRKIPYSPE